MKSEFIERTGFEPTADEYEEIEREYMGTDADKDVFCKQWKKTGGAERLMRIRARRIEELEAQVAMKDKLFEERTAADAKRYHELFDNDRKKMLNMEETIKTMQQSNLDLADEYEKMKKQCEEAERKLAVIKEAFEIMTGREATA